LAILEAMDAGVAVVGTRVGGIPEALGDNQAGLLVDPDNPSALAQALLKLLKNPSLRREMGDKGKDLVTNLFNLQKQTKLLVDGYEFLFQRQSKRALRL
jgi:glycosyltransferase involved in cell wall biosynthesis